MISKVASNNLQEDHDAPSSLMITELVDFESPLCSQAYILATS